MFKTLIVFIFFSFFGFTQNNNIDSLATWSYKDLAISFTKKRLDSVTALNRAKAYLLKAKTDKDTIKMANGFYFLSHLVSDSLAMKYNDSIILLTNDLQNHLKYPSVAYENKGIIYHDSGDFDRALELYLLALKHAPVNSFNHASTKFNIAFLKYRLGFREEAKSLFRSYLTDLDNLNMPDKLFFYNRGLYLYSDALIYTKKLDSAELIIAKGIKTTINSEEDPILYYRFLLNSGINSYYKKKYSKALDSLLKSLEKRKDDLSMAINHSYLGKTFYALGDKETAIEHLKEAHIFLEKTEDVAPELLDGYQFLIDYYKSKNDYPNQLYYINSLMKFDSVYHAKSKRISQKIAKNYEIPNLLREKEGLIKSLEVKGNKNRRIIMFLVIISGVGLFFTLFYLRRNRILKKRFDQFIQQYKNKDNQKDAKNTAKNSQRVSDDLTEKILMELEKFEKKQLFLNKKYNLNTLAKEINTNSAYLSKVINSGKDTNFANYLNNLRINYAINRLTKDKIFRAYTIKAISEESGFNSHQTFSSAFQKKTRLQPSYFIKQLEKSME